MATKRVVRAGRDRRYQGTVFRMRVRDEVVCEYELVYLLSNLSRHAEKGVVVLWDALRTASVW